jgi:galactose oxidase-like protein
MRPRPVSSFVLFSFLCLTVPALSSADVAVPLLPARRTPPPAPRLDAYAPAKPARSSPSSSEGTWRNYGLLQTDNNAAFYDRIQDRLISMGGDRDGAWELPLSGTMAWREIVHANQPWPVGWWGSEYDPSTGLVYFVAIGPNRTLVICRMEPRTGGFEPLWTDGAPNYISFMSMVLDPVHQRVIVFGGQNLDNFELPDDVWVLDLAPTRKWSHWTPAGESPQGRIGGALIVDTKRNRMLVLGGLANVNPGVWALSLDENPTWTRLSDTALPGDANANGMLLDEASDRVLAFHPSGDAWSFDLRSNQWSVLPISGPRPRGRLFVPLVMDTQRHRMLLAGGLSADETDNLNDAWALSLDGPPHWTPLVSEVIRPSVRSLTTGALDTARNRLLMFGGASTLEAWHQDTWALDLSTTRWCPVATQGTPPSARIWHATAYDPVRDQLVVFGGRSTSDSLLSDLWTLTFAGGVPTWNQRESAGARPPARFLSALIYEPPHDRFLLLYGAATTSTLTDVWELRFTPEPVWRQMVPYGTVPTRAGHAASFDPARDQVVMFGGYSKGVYMNDVWRLDLTSGDGAWSPIYPAYRPSPRSAAFLQVDPARDRLLLFGGEGDANLLNDAWELHLSGALEWRELAPEGPLPPTRSGVVGAFDAVRDRLVLFGGGGSWFAQPNDTWGLEFGETAAALQLSLSGVDATPERVRITWTASVPNLGVRLDRALGEGSWQRLGTLNADALGQIAYDDRDVSSGAFLRYRLAVVWEGEELLLGLASVTVPTRALALQVGNPITAVRLSVELPSDDPATLIVYDVAGRRVWTGEVGGLGPGKFDVTPEGARWHSGIYFALLTQAGQTRRTRFALLR